VIDDLQLQELGGRPERTAYVLSLRQFFEPAEPEDPAALDSDIAGGAADLMNLLVDGLALGPVFATGLEKFVETLSSFLQQLQKLRPAP
jgi:hypothetical protein